jgi:hypothetical protein
MRGNRLQSLHPILSIELYRSYASSSWSHKIDIKDMLGLMPFFPQPAGQGGGQLRVNQKAHILTRLPISDN